MSLDGVIQRILDKGAAEKNEIIGTARKEKEKLLKESRNKGKMEISSRLDEAGNLAKRLKVQETARAELESRKIVLAAQKEVLDAVRAEVLQRLASPEIRTSLLRELLEKHKDEWRTGKVYCNTEDQKTVKSVVGSRFGGLVDCTGGMVIESEDKTMRIDLRFETLLQDIWEDSVKELAELLWQKR